MPGARDDYLLRTIAQAAAALRRLRERLLGGGAPDEVVRDTQAAIGELMGSHAAMLSMLDAASALSLVPDKEKARAWVGLLRLEAEAIAASGNAARAAQLMAKVSALEERLVLR